MVFSSSVFLFIFLPIILVAHALIKNTAGRNALLIVASLVFYAYGEPVYVVLLLASVAVNYLFGRILSNKKNKIVLAVAVTINILLLAVFKYTSFIAETVNCIPGINIPVPQITMPIGISFFTFQAISYVVDTYRREDNEKAGFFDVLLYISLFPQLIAGPIVKYNSIREQIKKRIVTVDGMADGIRRFIIGLAKKMLISNVMGEVADRIFSMETGGIDMPLAWVGAVCYTLQIYFDFSGYSDMALGLGKAMGFDFPENFNYPYSASGIRDFWRRWHMSLTGWFREYLYIPMGGNRKGKGRQIFNNMVVFLCTGIWHGANFTFIIWGVFHGILMSVETLIARKKGQPKFNFFKWIYTMFFVIIGFVVFRADSIGYAVSYIGKMFSFTTDAGADAVLLSIFTPVFIATLLIALIAAWPIIPEVKTKLSGSRYYKAASAAGYAVAFLLYLLCVMTLAANSYNPFIYFRF